MAASAPYSLAMTRDRRGLSHLGSWVDTVVQDLELPERTAYALRLCLEEAVVNTVMHGIPAPGAADDTVRVHVESHDTATIDVTIEDSCAAFDPLGLPPPTRPESIMDAPIGGLGVHLMRQYTSRLAYARVGELNRLTMTIGGHEA